MHSVELERDLQDISELTEQILRGQDEHITELQQRLLFICGKVSAWQWCIHGDSVDFRKMVIKWLMQKGKYVLAKRYALCGKGDLLLKHDKTGKARVKPMGCGARFCPRCSRRAGRKHLSRVASHLSNSPHGSLWHIVLTQPGLAKESIGSTRDRFEKSWKAFYPTLRKCGLVSALATYHVKPNEKYGWHYHCHLVVEFDDAVDHDSLFDRINQVWKIVTSKHLSHLEYKDVFMRLVADAGPALVGMENNTQLEFWDEPKDQVEKVLHYVLRDVLQGIEGWIGALGRETDCFDFCDFLGSAKRHRSYGKWRKKVANNTTEESDASEESRVEVVTATCKKIGGMSEWSVQSTMDRSLSELRNGDRVSSSLVMQLIGSTNRSKGVLFRLRQVVKSIAA